MNCDKVLCSRGNLRGIVFFMVALLIFVGGVAEAANVGLYGSNSNSNIASLLTSNGHTVTDFGGTAPTPAELSGLDVVILLRVSGNTAISDFVYGGGLLITEWNASEWALNTANLLDADDVNDIYGSSVPVLFTAQGTTLGQGVSNPYSDENRTDCFRDFANIGGSVMILATRPGNIPAIISGPWGSGNVLIIGYDWADSFDSANADTRQLILNAVDYPKASASVAVLTMTEWGMILFMVLAGLEAAYYLRRQRRLER